MWELDNKCVKTDLNKVTKNQPQHWTETQRNESLNLLKSFEDLFDRTLGKWILVTVGFKIKEEVKPISSRPYPVLKEKKEMFKI